MANGFDVVICDAETRYIADDCMHCFRPLDAHFYHELGFRDQRPCSPGNDAQCYTKIGWENKAALGLSIACAYDYRDEALHWVDSHTLAGVMQDWVTRQVIFVGFNSRTFDAALFRAILRHAADATPEVQSLCDAFKLLVNTKGYDLLEACWNADPAGKRIRGINNLDSLCEANGYPRKEMDGALAPVLWRQGRYAEVIAYNVGDVQRTRLLFEQSLRGEPLQRVNGRAVQLAVPIALQAWRKERQRTTPEKPTTEFASAVADVAEWPNERGV